MDDEIQLDAAVRATDTGVRDRAAARDGVVIPPMPDEMREKARAHERAGFPAGPRDDPVELRARVAELQVRVGASS